MRKRTKEERPVLVRVIVDPRDGSRDIWMEKEEAKKQVKEGKLDYDLTNNCACIKEA